MENVDVAIKSGSGNITITVTGSTHNKNNPRVRIKNSTARRMLMEAGHSPGELVSGAVLDNANFSADFNLVAEWVFLDSTHVAKKVNTTPKKEIKKDNSEKNNTNEPLKKAKKRKGPNAI